MAGEIFISYRRSDQAKATLLHKLLKERGVDAWYDALLDAGDDWRHKTANALVNAPIFVLLFSKAASESDDISKELAAATFQKKTVIPVRIENIRPEGAFLYELASRNWFDAFEDTDARMALLADRLAALVKGNHEEAKEAAKTLGAPAAAVFQARAQPLLKKPAVLAGLAVGVVAVVAGVFVFLQPKGSAVDPNRVVFYDFTTVGDDPDLKAIATTGNEQAYSVMSRLHVPIVAPADAKLPEGKNPLDHAADMKARFAATGEIQRENERVRIALRLFDVTSRTLIAERTKFESPARPLQVGYSIGLDMAWIANCMIVGAEAFKDGPADGASLALIGKSCLEYGQTIVTADRELVKRNPSSAMHHAQLATDLTYFINEAPESARSALLAEVNKAVARAEELNPADYAVAVGRGVVGMANGKPLASWLPQLEEALQRPPGRRELSAYANANSMAGVALLAVGRTADAHRYLSAAADNDPVYARYVYDRIITNAVLGRKEAARNALTYALPRWYSDFSFEVVLSSAVLLDVIDPEFVMDAAPDDPAVPCYRVVIATMKASDRKSRENGKAKSDACLTDYQSPQVNVQLQTLLGDLDRAFELAGNPPLTDTILGVYPPFFLSTTRAMRADPRFIPLMEKYGFMEYWKQTKTKPDVCATPEERNIPVCVALR